MTFLFTDVEGSTRLWEAHPEAMRDALEIHDQALRRAIAANGGYVFSTAGDSFGAAFHSVADAAGAAVRFQVDLDRADWPATGPLRVRCGIHAGEAQERGGDYFGRTLNRCARLMAIAYGGQVLVTGQAASLVRTSLPDGCSLIDLGKHRLKDLEAAEHVYQLDHPSLLAEFPPLRSLGRYATNLPVYASSFVGRSAELTELATAVASSRLVTLVGPGGAGKTRLATHAAADLVDGFPGGLWFVDLSVLTEPRLVPNAVARAMGLDESGDDVIAQVAADLDTAPSLVILDNCEHLVAAAATVGEALLRRAANLTIVATSREPLEVPGESLYRVEPMPVPDDVDAADLLERDAVRLFAERGSSADPTFQLVESNVALVADICRRLDGIPLAIELAAARLRHLGVRDISERLDDRFALLSRGVRTAASRQQTLRNVVDWSYELLDTGQQVMFQRTSVFAGTFSLEAVEAVCGFAPLSHGQVLDLLGGLVDRSLVRIESTDVGRRRYRLLETLRAYAADRLDESGGAAELSRRHVDYLVAFAGKAKSGVRGSEATLWHDRIADELDDLRAVLQRTIGAGDIVSAARIAAGCWFHWYVRGHWDEGFRWLAAVDEMGTGLQAADHADVLRGLGGLATALGRLEVGAAALTREVELRRGLDDDSALAAAMLNLANAHALDGRYEQALALYEESKEISQRIGEETSSVTSNIAWTALDMGDFDLAGARFAETLALARAEGERRNEAWGHLGLGVVHWLSQDLDGATASLSAAQDIFAEYQEHPMVAFCRTFAAKVARDRGEIEVAVEMLRDIAEQLSTRDDPGGVGRWLVAAAVVECERDRFDAAARLIGAVGDVNELPPWERIEVDRIRPRLEAELGHDGYEGARAAGSAAGRSEALRVGLGG